MTRTERFQSRLSVWGYNLTQFLDHAEAGDDCWTEASSMLTSARLVGVRRSFSPWPTTLHTTTTDASFAIIPFWYRLITTQVQRCFSIACFTFDYMGFSYGTDTMLTTRFLWLVLGNLSQHNIYDFKSKSQASQCATAVIVEPIYPEGESKTVLKLWWSHIWSTYPQWVCTRVVYHAVSMPSFAVKLN